MNKSIIILGLLLGLRVAAIPVFAQPPAAQTAGGVAQQEKAIQKQKTLEERIKEKRASKSINFIQSHSFLFR